MLGHYAFFPASPWWLTLCPSKWSSLGMGLLLGTPLMSHHTVPNHTYHFPSLFPSVSLSLGILGCIDPRRGCPSFYGKKFIQSICGRSKLPNLDCLWANCTQEETRLAARGMQCSHHDENQSLATHERKSKGKRIGFDKTFKGRK